MLNPHTSRLVGVPSSSSRRLSLYTVPVNEVGTLFADTFFNHRMVKTGRNPEKNHFGTLNPDC
jgi:hypothetical protein